jgi:hypothetical protein
MALPQQPECVQGGVWKWQRMHAACSGAPPEALARESVEEVRRWNRERERWERLWREARVRAAPVPKALAICLGPLRIREGPRCLPAHFPHSWPSRPAAHACACMSGSACMRPSGSSVVFIVPWQCLHALACLAAAVVPPHANTGRVSTC